MKIVVFGATSDIAAACLELWAARGDSLHLCSRDLEQQALLATRLRERWGVEVLEDSFDAGDATALTAIVERIEAGGGEIDLVLLAFGLLGKNREALHDPVLAGQIIQVNFTATVHLLTALLPLLERQHRSRIAVISSVAGERG
ncbi:MAG: SDR family NAD(P)-dependent oxidoreductase, partial [Candidatus Delongbacteria bacterium]|nr:SDR family NAD(P)-dependent oxidoreductase [Candidatus Delongbacteria bacterium]